MKTQFVCARCRKPKDCTPRRGMCPACYMTWNTRQHAYGRFVSKFAEAAPVRDHVALLMASGLSVRYIAASAGVNRKAVSQLYAGRKGKTLEHMSAATAAKILAVQPAKVEHAVAADHQPVAALGTRRRLQSLVAFGYTGEELAGRLNFTQSSLSAVLTGKRESVLAVTARSVEKLFADLHTVPGPSCRARYRAQRNGWPVPLAWDEDTIDDPAAVPQLGERITVNFVERYTELRDLGVPDWEIAKRLGIKLQSLVSNLERAGLTAGPQLRELAAGERRQGKAS